MQDYDEANSALLETRADLKKATKEAHEAKDECSQLTQKYDAIKGDLRKFERGELLCSSSIVTNQTSTHCSARRAAKQNERHVKRFEV